MRKITCWYRAVNGERQYNHFTYGWSDLTSPLALYKKQRQMWKGVTWEKTYGYLVDGVVKEFPCKVCPYYPNCENDTCGEAFEEYEQREKAVERMKVRESETK